MLLKNNLKITDLIIIVLLVIIFLQRCGGGHSSTLDIPIIKRDTMWIIKDSTVYSKPQLIKTIPVDVSRDTIIREYLPDTTYEGLLKDYQAVVFELLNKNIYQDSLKIDSIGYVKVVDTVSKNSIVGRSYNYNLKYPIIKETIIQPAKKTNQLYIGGMLFGSPEEPISSVNTGLLFKNKKDQIFGGSVGLNRQGELQYGIQSFWKIKLKK